MAPVDAARCLPCRHAVDEGDIDRLVTLLTNLPREAPELVRRHGLPADEAMYDVVFAAAVESMRGTHAATTSIKKRFIEAVLAHVLDSGQAVRWDFVGTEGRQDYRVGLPDGTTVAIEAKGCPDGNNMTIWERPAWANEFVVWSQCPESLAHQPGKGTWSGTGTRLIPKSIAEGVVVDAMIFWDGRCGTDLRRCPKGYGVEGLRAAATDIPGQDDRDWVPPPCIYLFPRTVARVPGNPRPALHSARTCRFADAMLAAFNVPEEERDAYLHTASVEMELRSGGRYIKVTVEVAQPGPDKDTVAGGWKRLRRE